MKYKTRVYELCFQVFVHYYLKVVLLFLYLWCYHRGLYLQCNADGDLWCPLQ